MENAARNEPDPRTYNLNVKPTSSSDLVKAPDEKMKPTDIIILVMGQTGVGKSSFINAALGTDIMPVNNRLTGIPGNPKHVVCQKCDWEHRVVLVDTPGLNDTFTPDTVIVEHIINWISSCQKNMVLGGIIFLIRAGEDPHPSFHRLKKDTKLQNTFFAVISIMDRAQHRSENHPVKSPWEIVSLIADETYRIKVCDAKKLLSKVLPTKKHKHKGLRGFFARLFDY